MRLANDSSLVTTWRCVPLLVALGLSFLMPAHLYAGVVADRIVVAVNSIPYSQLQIERYIDVKESLRDNIASSQTVQQSNWALALDAFIRDMMKINPPMDPGRKSWPDAPSFATSITQKPGSH